MNHKRLKFKGFLFDLDGTLVDSLPAIQGAVNSLRVERGLDSVGADLVRTEIGLGLRNLLGKLILAELTTQEPLESLVEGYRKHYLELSSSTRLYEGVEATLTELKGSGARFGIVTNRTAKLASATINALLPNIVFDCVVGVDSVQNPKPHPEPITTALIRLRLSRDHVIYVGDHEVDQQSARSAQVAFLGAGYGYGEHSWGDALAVSSFRSLLEHVYE